MSTDIPQIYTVKQKSLYEINELLNLKNRRTNQDNARQIIKDLQENYAYEGEYDTRYIREFLKIYYMNYNHEIDNYIREIKLDNIKNVDDKYYIDENIYKQLINPHYTERVVQYAQNILHQNRINEYIESLDANEHDIFNADIETLNELNRFLGLPQCDNTYDASNQIITELITRYQYFGEYNIEYIHEIVDLYSTAFFDGEEGMEAQIKLNSLVSNEDYNDIEVVGQKHYMDEQSYQIIHDDQYLNDVEKLAPEEIQHQKELEMIALQNDEQNNFLTNKDMAQQPQRQIKQLPEFARQRGSKNKVGMTELANIVLNMQRDFKRVANALSVPGAQAIVDKHNAISPNSKWRVRYEDFNKDNIPDIVIVNDKNNPIVVNGWTTKQSDYPERHQYYQKYPTREERKGHPFQDFKRDELYQYQYDDTNPNAHIRGNVTSYNKNAFPSDWQLGKYNVEHKPRTRLSAYQRFQRYVLKPRLDFAIQRFIENDIIETNENGSWDGKLQIIAKLTGYLWNKWVVKTVADRYGKSIDDKDFVKYKNRKEGKQEIDTTVTALYYHLAETNSNWTEEQRQNLENQFIHDLFDTLEKLVRHVQEIQQHHYYEMGGQHNAHNAETEGDFGEFDM